MKRTKVILTLVVIVSTLSVFAAKPPESVRKAFEQRYPETREVVWTKESPAIWEAIFTINGARGSVEFSVDGTWIETEVEILGSELPEAARAKILTECTEWTLLEANKIDTGETGVIFAVDLQKGILKKVVSFHADGTLLSEE